ARPRAVFQADALAEAEELLAKTPEPLLQSYAPVFVVVVDAKIVLPFIGAEAHGRHVQSKLLCECRLARTRQTTDENQSRFSHAKPTFSNPDDLPQRQIQRQACPDAGGTTKCTGRLQWR